MSGNNLEPAPAPALPISVRVREAVRITGLSRSRIYELMRDGDIQYAKDGRATLILVASLRSYVEARIASPTAMS